MTIAEMNVRAGGMNRLKGSKQWNRTRGRPRKRLSHADEEMIGRESLPQLNASDIDLKEKMVQHK